MIFNENIIFKDLSTTKGEDLKEEEDIEVGPVVAQQALSRPTQTICVLTLKFLNHLKSTWIQR